MREWSIYAESDIHDNKISPDGKTFVTFNNDSDVVVWNCFDGKSKYTLSEHNRTGFGIGFSSDCMYLVSRSYDQTYNFWDLNNGRYPLTYHRYEETVDSTKFLTNHQLVVAFSQSMIFYYDFGK